MKWLMRILPVLVLATLLARPAEAQGGRQVWAYYMGWWTNESWSSDLLTDRPLNAYDSRDAGALGRHIDEARGAGIDAFVMSWFGPKNGNLTNQVFNSLLDQAGARGFRVGVTVDMFQADYNANIAEVTESISYIINDRANHPAYLRYNGKPVIFFWNQGRFSVGQWNELRRQLDPNHNTIWVAEGTSTAYIGAFDGIYLFNTAWSRNNAAATTYATRTRNAGGTFYVPTVLPGWNEDRVAAREGRGNPTSEQARAGGEFLTRSWNGAVNAGTDVILIVSWNEYFENSHIEPSQNHGTAALDTLRPLIAAWEGGSSAPAAAPAAPTGNSLTATAQVNVRAEPNTGAARLGRLNRGDVYAITGQTNGWYSINYNGQTGWVSAGYVTTSGGAAPAAVVPAPGGLTFTALYELNVRGGPGTNFDALSRIPAGSVVQIVGRTNDSSWLQVNANGVTGWVSAQFGSISGDVYSVGVTG